MKLISLTVQGPEKLKRGTSAAQRGLSREQIPVLVARDRSEHGNTLKQRLVARDASSVMMPCLAW